MKEFFLHQFFDTLDYTHIHILQHILFEKFSWNLCSVFFFVKTYGCLLFSLLLHIISSEISEKKIHAFIQYVSFFFLNGRNIVFGPNIVIIKSFSPIGEPKAMMCYLQKNKMPPSQILWKIRCCIQVTLQSHLKKLHFLSKLQYNK